MSGNNNGAVLFDAVKEKTEKGEHPRIVFQIDLYTDVDGRESEDRLGVAIASYSLYLPKEDRDLDYIVAWDMVQKDLRKFEKDRMQGARAVGVFNGEINFKFPLTNRQAGADPMDVDNTKPEVLAALSPERWGDTPKHLRRFSRGKGLDTKTEGAVTYF